MLVTKLEPITKKRMKVYLDYELAFALYPKELKQFGIKEDEELEAQVVDQIIKEIIIPRAKKRAMYFLKSSDRTSHELASKLKQAFYPEVAVEKALEYVTGYGYIDDNRYAEAYVRIKGQSRSQKQLAGELRRKGIDKDIIQSCLEETDTTEHETLYRLVEKRLASKGELTPELLQKTYAFFYRKGFSIEDIKQTVKEQQEAGGYF